jgi:LL-diaminopimelate aminotransferase
MSFHEELAKIMWTEMQAKRLRELPPYLFAEIDRIKAELVTKGVDVIDLGVGDPDLPTPPHVIQRLQEAAKDPANHRYPSYSGMDDFRSSVAQWYQRRFGVELDAKSEVVSLIGSKEGIAHIPLAFVDPGDLVIVPDPGYPVYHAATTFAGGETHLLPLRSERGFLPDLSEISNEVAKKAKMVFMNYPNNPTGATAPLSFFGEVVKWAKANQIMVCHDAAYTELAFDGYRASSMMEVKGAREVAVEFHSLSKTYNMTGWRIGFAVGNSEIVGGLGRVKTNIDSGIFQSVQYAGMAALDGDQKCVEDNNRIYQERRDILVHGLQRSGLKVRPPKATFYVWCEVPPGYDSRSFTTHLLSEMGIVTTPGNGFGQHGEGYVRMALTVEKERVKEAVRRLNERGF